MKVLSIINFTNIDDYNSDSGYIFNYILMEEFQKSGNTFGVIIPNQLLQKECKFKSNVYYVNLGTTKYEARFGFDWKGIENAIIDFNPDYILLNECEMAVAIRLLLNGVGKSGVKIASYCHYPAIQSDCYGNVDVDESLNDLNVGQIIVARILDAVNISDCFFIQSQYAKDLLIKYAKKINYNLKRTINVVSPPFDPFLLSNKKNSGNKIIYNHRLYELYGAKYIIKTVEMLPQIDFLILNPMMHRSRRRGNTKTDPMVFCDTLNRFKNACVVDGSESRKKYKEYLERGKIGIAAYRTNCVWSMSVIDCVCENVPVIAPNFAAYTEMIPEMLRFNSIQEEIELIKKLLTNDDFYQNVLNEERKILSRLKPSTIFQKLYKVMEGQNE